MMRIRRLFKHGTYTVFLCCVIWPALPSCAKDDPDCKQELESVLQDLAQAYSDRDAERVLDFYSDYFNAPGPPFTKKGLRDDVERLMRSSSRLEVTYPDAEILCAGKLAVANVAVEFKRRPTDEDDLETENSNLQIRFEQENGQWKIDEFLPIDPHAPVPQPGVQYDIARLGFAAAMPEGFRYYNAESPFDSELVVGLSKDLKISITLSGQDMSILIEPDQLADIMANQARLYFPNCDVTRKDVQQFQDLPGVILETQCPQFERETWARTVVLMDKKTLLIASVSTWDKSGRKAGEDVLRKLLKSVKRIPRETHETPPRPTLNEDFEITLPEGWTTTRNDKGVRIHARAPSQCGTIIIFTQDLLEDEDPMALITKHDDIVEQLTRDFSCDGPRTLRIGSLRGAQSVSEFQVGQKVKRWRAYIINNRKLYAIICDAQPAEKYAQLEKDFRATVDSLRLKSDPDVPEEPDPK